MIQLLRSRRRLSIVALVLALAGAAMAFTLGGKLLPASAKKNAPVAASRAPQLAQEKGAQTVREVLAPALPILLKPRGFVPREISRPTGSYYFAVGNVSGVREVFLRLERERGARLQQVNAKREKPWRQIVQLAPGTYLLTEENHPDWTCRITITPR